ncbi:DUF5372 family protein [Streptomyces halobius]|uniref:Y4bD/Y4pK family protein n=1 Tax=Streptomyces halobius TaxID=2879846 RepID=A0ABY4M0Q1_9ACTN|nr:DUF5372 family protein [Streptomyces halobius]UQA91340.1 Y4bD/Y4pK family protein [Streptomyces halobius]
MWPLSPGSSRSCPCHESSTAPDQHGQPGVVRVTHPFHPWHGREFAFVDRCLAWDVDRVSFLDENGEVASLPAAWTDIDPVDPFVVVADGPCPFRVQDLLAAADLLDALRSRTVGKKMP